jgi:hypothetical protein
MQHPKPNEHCAFVYSSVFLFSSSQDSKVYDEQWLGDQQLISWKGLERNRFFPHRIYCPGICPKTEQNTKKPSATIVGSLTRRRNMVSPECKAETSFASAKFSASYQ